MASLTTTPSRVFLSPTVLSFLPGARRRRLGPLAQQRLGPRQIAPRLPDPRRVLGDPHRELEPEVEQLLRQFPHPLPDLVLRQVAPLGRFHRSLLTGSALTALARASRTSSRSPSSVRRSAMPRARHPRRRPPSHSSCDPASPPPPIPPACPCP